MTLDEIVAVLAEHYPFTWSGPEQTQTCEAGVCHAAIWPCLPYRLAQEAQRLAGKMADAWDEGYEQANDDVDWLRPRATRRLTDNPYRAEPEHPHGPDCCEVTHP